MEVEEKLLRQKAKEGYVVCFNEGCPRHEQCLRYDVGRFASSRPYVLTSVNPKNLDVKENRCLLFRANIRQRMARGMTSMFNNDMPVRVINGVRHSLYNYFGRTYYFEYRSGKRLLSPEKQQYIAELFQSYGWHEPPHFDAYLDEYDW